MASLIIGGGGYSPAVHPMESFSVWVKYDWGSTWIRVPYMIPVSFEETAFPAMGSARVRWEYGPYVNRWYHSGGTLLPVNLENWMIKIHVHTVYGSYIGFIGQVIGETMVDEGLDPSTGLPIGVQELECADISVMLKRRRVIGTFVGDGENWTYLKRTRGFNVGYSQSEARVENRSTTYNDEAGCYMFQDGGATWSNHHIAEYLLACFQPWYPIGNTAGGVLELAPIWRMSGQVAALNSLYSEANYWGRDVRGCLEELIDRRRGFGAHVVTDGDGPIYLEVFSLSEYPIEGLGASIPANPRQVDVPLGNDHHIQATYQITEMRAVDEIVVESDEPIKVMATWGFADGSLEEGWDGDAEIDFINIATDEERNSDLYAAVYSKYQVPSDFDLGTWVPAVDDFGNVSLALPGAWWHHDLSCERYLPIEERGVTSGEVQYIEPLVLISTADRYRELAEMLEADGNAPYDLAGAQGATDPPITSDEFDTIADGDGSISSADIAAAIAAHPLHYFFLHKALSLGFPSCSMRIGDRGLSLYIEHGEGNQIFARGHFTGESEVTSLWDYETLLATMFFRTDEVLRVRLPVWNSTYIDPYGRVVREQNPQGRQIHIVVPGQECWVAAANTVVDVDDGVLVYHNDGDAEIIRNDIARLRWTAMVAYVWYGTPRASVRLQIANHLPWFRIGDLIRSTVNGYWWERVGTCVTSIVHDCERCTQTVTTSFGEMDPEVLAEGGRKI